MGRPTLAIAGTRARLPSVRSGWVLLATARRRLVPCRQRPPAGWLPHAADATWTYQWTDSVYNTTPTNEAVTVKSAGRLEFRARLDDRRRGQSARRAAEHRHRLVPGDELRPRQHRLVEHAAAAARSRSSARRSAQCGNSLASTYYNVIWGGARTGARRAAAHGPSWSATGGAQNDVTSTNDYLGTESITVPAFPHAGHSRRRSARRSRRPVRSAIPTAAACARSGGSTASAR